MRALVALMLLLLPSWALATVHTVHVADDFFDPPDIVVGQGDSVRFVFDGPSSHSATAAAGQVDFFDTGVQPAGLFYEVTFNTLGVINYYCVLHGSDLGGGLVSGMSGSVEVVVPAIDTDGDGLSDDDEINVYGTDPNLADTDGGSVDDGDEIANGTDPLDPTDDIGPFTLSGPTPGVADADNLFTTVNGTPAAKVVYFRSDQLVGTTPVTGCPGLKLDMSSPLRFDKRTNDGFGGSATIKFVPASAAGQTWRFQALDPASCTVSNPIDYTF